MDVGELEEKGVPSYAVQRILDKGIEELNPPQADAVDNGLLDGESLVVSSPTASGKTLIATMAISKLLDETDKKALYLVPLKALGSEKHRDYREFFEEEDVDVALSVGDRDSSDQWIETKDLIIMTVEKLDAVLRHNPSWISQVDLVVVDEIHLLNSEGRGPTLEVTLTRLMELMDFQLLGLSATINNSGKLAEWLDSGLVESDYRPVDLKEGVYLDGEISFHRGDESSNETNSDNEFVTGRDKLEEERSEETIEDRAETVSIAEGYGKGALNVLDDTLRRDNQAITFVRSRKSAESEAEKAGKVVGDHISREEERQLEELADRVENVLGSPTKQCRRLASCVRNGTAFHHAGLVARQRTLLEENFREGLIKSISATPTLAAGVSLPAYRIIIRDVKRYTDNGLQYIPVLEFKQMAGRAGRPEHHDEGHAIAIASETGQKNDIRDRYILGEPEKIYSKLAVEPVLRMHALGLIATRFAPSFEALSSFFEKTFYAYQYGDTADIVEKLENVVGNLEEYGFVDEDEGKLNPTKIGERVAELYIDPYTAHHLLQHLEQAEKTSPVDVALLHSLSQTVEMKPRFRVRKSEKADVEDMLAEVQDELFEEAPEPWDIEYEQFLASLKTAMCLKEWIGEVGEDELMDRYNVTPGGIRAKVERADWLLYACSEICTLKEWGDARSEVKKLRTRVKHGIREELLPLVRFKGIGRVRARRLHDDGISTTSDIRNASFNHLKNLTGKRTAENLKGQVGQDNVFDKENILDYMEKNPE